jgi:hypothetical protein
MKKPKVAKKADWQKLDPQDQFRAFTDGNAFTKDIQADSLFGLLSGTVEWVTEYPPEHDFQIFTSQSEGSIEKQIQLLMVSLCVRCVEGLKTGDAAHMQNIAEAIKLWSGP